MALERPLLVLGVRLNSQARLDLVVFASVVMVVPASSWGFLVS